jgi:formylglycine-generating enzyme required for sulfatase activity
MATAASGEKLKVFISYSRRDSKEFVDELAAGLELAGFAPLLDRHDIAPGEKWGLRLGGLVRQADTLVFVVSPEAVKSEYCALEVETALAEAKRVFPVVFKSVPERDIPEELRSRQFIHFDTGAGITRPLTQLAEALRQDIDWIREHTRLSELAKRWQTHGRQEALLLRGGELAAAQAWSDQANSDSSQITDLVRDYIASSKTAEAALLESARMTRRRMRRSRAMVVALSAIVVVVMVVGWQQAWLRQGLYLWWNVHALTAEHEKALKPGDPFGECTNCPEMVVIPAGHFSMGSPDAQNNIFEPSPHNVAIAKPFAVSRYQLTFANWDACVKGGGCNGYMPDDQGWGPRDMQPVINVSWNEATEYVAWLSNFTKRDYRLLSEAQYEYAARAGAPTAYPWGNGIKFDGQAMANCAGCGSKWDDKQTAPVGSFSANKFGLYQMLGNVWEWTQDCYHENYNNAPADGSAWLAANGGDCGSHVVRGGSWNFPTDSVHSAHRWRASTGARSNDLGFRVARKLAQ